MKTLYLFMLFAFVQNAGAQDFCKQIKKEVSADKSQFDYFSPFTEDKLPAVRVTRSINVNPDMAYDNFFLVFRTVTGDVDNLYIKSADGTLVEKEEKTLVVEFEDKSKISDDTVQVNHDFTEDRAEGIRTLFYPLTEANLKDFTTKKIVKFSLGGFEQTFRADSANAVMQYIKCMKSVEAK